MHQDVITQDNNETANKNSDVKMAYDKKKLETCQTNKSCNECSLFGPLISFFNPSKSESNASLNNGSITHPNEGNSGEIRVYHKRFWNLFLFTALTMLNSVASMQYSAITNTTVCYYGVTISNVNWMALVYSVASAVVMFPAAWFLERYGLRPTIIIGSSLTSLGVVVQCASLKPDGYLMGLIGQIIGAVAQCFIVNAPPRLATAWFGPSEVSKATAIGVFGNQLGAAIGFIFSAYAIPSDCSRKDLIQHGKEIMTYTLIATNLFLLLLILLTFENKPRLPPSPAEALKSEEPNFKITVLTLVKNLHFDLLCIGYALIIGLLYALVVCLNQMFYPLYPSQQKEIGLLGFHLNLSGLFGVIALGYILDLTHKFKETSMVILGCSFLCMCVFTGLLYVKQLWVQFVTTIALGFFLSSYLTLGLDFAAEITYPAPEGTSAGIMMVVLMVLGPIVTEVGSHLIAKYGNLSCNLFFCATALLGFILTGMVKCECRRLKENMENTKKENLSAANQNHSLNEDTLEQTSQSHV